MPDRIETVWRSLRRAGLRCTEQRLRILRCLGGMPRHFGAEEVLQALERGESGPSVSRATLYRFLSELERLGILRRVLLSEGHSHYEFARGEDEHCHVVCSRCGRVVEVRSAGLERAVRHICDEHGFEVEEAEVEITIVCDRCRWPDVEDPEDEGKFAQPGQSIRRRRITEN